MKKLTVILVIMSFLACDDIIEVVDISNETVTVLAPKSGVVLNDPDVTFTWEAIEDATSYKFQIATPNFENAQQIVIDSIVTSTVFGSALNSGNYEWRVRAENSNYTTGFSVQGFTISAPEPVDISDELIIIFEPTDNASFLTADSINFSWDAVESATLYTIEIATPDFENPTEILINEDLADTQFSISNLNANTYRFRVKAKNSGYETNYTEIGFIVN